MISALMSSLASVFNSCATIMALDVYKKHRPAGTVSERQLVWVGRLTVVAVASLSMAWLPVIPLLGDQLFVWIQKPPSYFAPPIFSAYLWGALSSRVSARGAGWSLAVGLSVGLLRFLLEIAHETEALRLPSGGIAAAFVHANFLHFSFLNFLLSSAVLFSCSCIGKPAPAPEARLLFHWRLYGQIRRRGGASVYENTEEVELVSLNASQQQGGGSDKIDDIGDDDHDDDHDDDNDNGGRGGPARGRSRRCGPAALWDAAIDAAAVLVLVLFACTLTYFN